jgi:DNA-binding MarR family transcriptional regulator
MAMATDPKQPELRDPLDDMIGYQLRRASLVTFTALNEQFEALGLRPMEAIIIRLVEANPGCNQAEISRSLGIQRTNMVPVIGAMVDAGLISRAVADGRSHALHLTDRGRAMHARIAAVADAQEAHFFGDLDAATRTTLLTVLQGIRANIHS